MSEYNVDSIKTMEFGKACRKRLGMYLSANLEEAIFLGLREIISNSVDEYLQGYGKKINIVIDTKLQRFTVSDEGRGIPVGIRPDGTNSLVAALTLPHTGGKLDNEVYNSAIGTNGIGASVVSHTAQELAAVVGRDGKLYSAYFTSDESGAHLAKDITTQEGNSKTGTLISYIPDSRVYGNNKLDVDYLKTYLSELQYLTPGLQIVLVVDNDKPITYYSANGLADALKASERFHKNPFLAKGTVDGVQIEFALQWAKTGSVKYYANSLYMPEGGAFTTGLKTSLTKAFNTVAEKEFKGELIRKYLTGYVSVKVKTPQFSNQAKTSLANPEARTAVAKFTTEQVKAFFTKNSGDLAAIVKIIEAEQKAEAAAQRAREAVNKVASGGKSLNALKDLPSKLADCNNYGGELWLCEGDSASGSAKSARDPATQAIMPLRGKVLNTCTKDVADILKNKEILDITTALGTGIGERFRLSNLRYDKIIIFSDADEDGKHISLLLCTLFLYHFPEIVKAGHLYRSISPFYRIKVGNNYKYFYSTEELNTYKKTHSSSHITRFKGLGELSPEELWETSMNPKSRRLEKLTVNDLEETIELFDKLMGDDAKLRREFIMENSEEEDIYG